MRKSKAPLLLILACILLIGQLLSACDSRNTNTTTVHDLSIHPDAFSIGMNPARDYLIVVNDKNEYQFGSTDDYELVEDLIYVSDCYGEPTPIEKGTNLAFSMLKQKLRDEGIEIELFSAYRTKDDQQAVYDYYSNLEGWAETNKVAEPGFSEHHTGLLLNIVIWGQAEEGGDMVWMTETVERQAAHPEFKIVHDTLADYGFIDRYPAGKEDITGVPSEPYEIRFVGSTKVAHAIMDNHLCLEEYLEGK